MYNLYTKFVRILEICKQFSENLVNKFGNIPRCGPVPKFSDLEVVVLSLTVISFAAKRAENLKAAKRPFSPFDSLP